ncbi:MAG: hypothetical protein JST69_03105 [Bacteroidetes bacterium]|nr:hypothetical protein [Bacteroidota bacterium]
MAQFVGQPGNVDIVGTGGTGNAGYSGLTKGFVSSAKIVSYDDVDGNCFWDQKWNRAVLFLSTGLQAIKSNYQKLSLIFTRMMFIILMKKMRSLL